MAYTTVNKSTDHFNTKLYTGNGGTNAVTGVGFQPDWSWIKNRSGSDNHAIYDAVRGVQKILSSNNTNAESTQSDGLATFGTDGFTVGADGKVNTNGNNFVAWNWKAGGTASTNNDGDNACSLSANATAGFSVSTHTVPDVGAGQYTIGHGLGKKPKLVIAKHTSQTGSFQTYFEGIGTENQQYLKLNDTNALANHSNLWGNGMTTSVVGLSNTALTAGTTSVVYAFAEINGYSKFGSYTANGNADGGFVYLGFKPSFLMIKRTDSAAGWIIYDNKREGRNTENDYLLASSSSAEGTNNEIDLYSNGFKPREANRNELNVSGGSYIYMAIGQSLVGSNNVPCVAR